MLEFYLLHLCLWSILSLVWYVEWGRGLTSFFDIWLSSYPIVEKTVHSPLNAIGTFDKNKLNIDAWVYFWTVNAILLIYLSVLMPIPGCFDYYVFVVNLKSGSVNPQASFFFSKLVAVIWGHLQCQMTSSVIFFFISTNFFFAGILIEVTLNPRTLSCFIHSA